MTRSVEELRQDSENSRVELAATVHQLRQQISDTAEDIRHRVSPQHIRSEVSDYVTAKAQSWLGTLKQQARANPMQAIAAGTAVAVPVLRLARGFPLPLLMIGAGLALTSKTVRERTAEAAAPAMDKASGILDDAAERAQTLHGDVKESVSSAQDRATGIVEDVQDTAAGVADDLRSRAAQTTATVADKLRSGMDAAKDAIGQAKGAGAAVKEAAATAPAKARRAVGDNAALIGGLGIAIGAIIAAALPPTKAEAKVMGQASGRVKQAADEATQSGFEAVKDATMSAADAATKSLTEADLGNHASRMTQNTADTLREAADDVVRAALAPSRNPNT